VRELDIRHTNLEQYSRRNTIELFGIPEGKDETTESLKDTVVDVGTALGVTVTKDDIDACHRISGGNNRPTSGIIVKFIRRDIPDSLLSKRKQKKDFSTRHLPGHTTDSPVYVNVSLAPSRRVLLAKSRKLRSDYNYKYVWVDRAGRVKARKSDDKASRVLVINDEYDLAAIIEKEKRVA
jgi:hypothetical protein